MKETTKTKNSRKALFYRWFFYLAGMVILAFGITLNTKTGLGVSPIISVSYSISEIFNLNFGNVTLVQYSFFVFMEFVLKGKKAKAYDVLQLPLSIGFTRLMNVFNDCVNISFPHLWQNLLLLILAVFLTGVGIVMTVSMRLIPNPGDGIVQAISDRIHKNIGFTKNIFDFLNISITLMIGFAYARPFLGIGLGTVIAVLGTGRAVALFAHFCKDKMLRLAEMDEEKQEKRAKK